MDYIEGDLISFFVEEKTEIQIGNELEAEARLIKFLVVSGAFTLGALVLVANPSNAAEGLKNLKIPERTWEKYGQDAALWVTGIGKLLDPQASVWQKGLQLSNTCSGFISAGSFGYSVLTRNYSDAVINVYTNSGVTYILGSTLARWVP